MLEVSFALQMEEASLALSKGKKKIDLDPNLMCNFKMLLPSKHCRYSSCSRQNVLDNRPEPSVYHHGRLH